MHLGRWNLTIHRPIKPFPTWLEDGPDGARLVGIWGSARPITELSRNGASFRASLPPQYEGTDFDLEFEGEVTGDTMTGRALIWGREWVPFTGQRAPELPGHEPTAWSEPIDLLADGLSGFWLRSADAVNHWSMQDGALVNAEKGSDIATLQRFNDFRLTAEYHYPAGSNSGIYLRGRYEVQIVDDYGQPALTVQSSGGIYGFRAPMTAAVNPPGELNRAEITLCGRWVEIVLNGHTVVPRCEIPGITGGALDSAEGEAGPILLQGDHGPVTFTKLAVQIPS